MKFFLFVMLLFTTQAFAKESLWTIEDIVLRARPVNGGVEVYFENNAGIYFLKKENKNFKQIKKLIDQSKKDGLQVEVISHASTLDIQDVVNK